MSLLLKTVPILWVKCMYWSSICSMRKNTHTQSDVPQVWGCTRYQVAPEYLTIWASRHVSRTDLIQFHSFTCYLSSSCATDGKPSATKSLLNSSNSNSNKSKPGNVWKQVCFLGLRSCRRGQRMSLQTDNTCLWVCVIILTSVDPDQRSVDWQVWLLHVNLWYSDGNNLEQPWTDGPPLLSFAFDTAKLSHASFLLFCLQFYEFGG